MRAWFCHAFQKHGYVSMQGEAAQGRTCPCCSKKYKSSLRLKLHLAHSGPCRAYMWLHKRDLPESDAEQPHSQMPWTYIDEGQAHAEICFDRDIEALTRDLDYLIKHDLEPVGSCSFVRRMAEKIQDTCTVVMPFSSIHSAFSNWARSLANSTDLCLLQVLEQVASWLIDRGKHLISTPEDHEPIPNEQDRLQVLVGPPSVRVSMFRPRVALFYTSLVDIAGCMTCSGGLKRCKRTLMSPLKLHRLTLSFPNPSVIFVQSTATETPFLDPCRTHSRIASRSTV